MTNDPNAANGLQDPTVSKNTRFFRLFRVKRLPTTVRQRRELVLRWVLSVVAGLLIVGGFAAPQIVQAVEFQSRGSFVARLAANYSSVNDITQTNDGATILMGLRLHQAKRFQGALEELVDLTEDTLTAEEQAGLKEAAEDLKDARIEHEEYAVDPLVLEALDLVHEARQGGMDEDNRALLVANSRSWPFSDVELAIDLFEVEPPKQEEIPKNLNKMTNAQFATVKQQLEESEQQLRREEERLNVIVADYDRLDIVVQNAFEAITSIVPALESETDEIQSRAEYHGYELEAFEAARDRLHQTVGAERFFLGSNGEVKPEAADRDSDAVELTDIGVSVQGMLIAQAVKSYLSVLETVKEDLLLLDEEEAERIAREEYERQLAIQQELERQRELENSFQPPPDSEQEPPPLSNQDDNGDTGTTEGAADANGDAGAGAGAEGEHSS